MNADALSYSDAISACEQGQPCIAAMPCSTRYSCRTREPMLSHMVPPSLQLSTASVMCGGGALLREMQQWDMKAEDRCLHLQRRHQWMREGPSMAHTGALLREMQL